MKPMVRRIVLVAATIFAAGLAPAQDAAPQPPPPADEGGPVIPEGSPPIPADQAQPASPDVAIPDAVPTDQPTGTTAPLPSAAPVPIKLSTLPSVLDHPGSLDDAVADEKGVKRSIVMGGLDKITARTFTFEVP